MIDRVRNSGKLAIVCRFMPPLVGGSAVLMKNLFDEYRGEIEAVTGWEREAKVDDAFAPPCKTHYLRLSPDALQRAVERIDVMRHCVVDWFVHRHLKRMRPAAVFAAYPDAAFFIAAFRASRKLGIPFWAHMHDLWADNVSPESSRGKLAQRWEPLIFREADKVFCMTEAQIDLYGKKYSRKYDLLPHCVPGNADYPDVALVKTASAAVERRILYTGNISPYMNLDSLKGFVAAIDLLPPNYRIKMLTSMSADDCRRAGIWHERIEYGWVSVTESRRMVQEADILFLPLSFKNCYAAEVRTVFSTKTLDYLLSGVPILVYSPSDSHHSCSARKSGWACVVDREDPHELARAIQELATDPFLRRCVVEKAVAEARRRDPRLWAQRLAAEVEAVAAQPAGK